MRTEGADYIGQASVMPLVVHQEDRQAGVMWIAASFESSRSDPLASNSTAVRVPGSSLCPGPLAAIDKKAAAHDRAVTTRVAVDF